MKMEDDRYVIITKCPLKEDLWKGVKCRILKWHENSTGRTQVRVRNGCWHFVTDKWKYEAIVEDVYPCKGCGALMYHKGYCCHCINASY